jgi:diguanylate cyclase (GGDEF)-like protein
VSWTIDTDDSGSALARPASEIVLLYTQGASEGHVLSGSLKRLLDIDAQADWLKAVHEDDRERVSREWAGGIFATPFDLHYRRASTRLDIPEWIHDRTVRIASHGVLRIVGFTASEVVPYALPDAIASLPAAMRLERRMLNALPDVVLVVTRELMVLDAFGPPLQLHAPAHDLLGHRLSERSEITPAVAHMWTRYTARALDSGRSQIFEYPLSLVDGDRDFEARLVPLGPDEVVAIVRDVSERNRLRERVQHLSMLDDLTGLLTRAALEERLEAQLSQHPATALSVMLLDLDRFKQVNDTFGRSIGDTLLKVIANRITRRAGGDALRARIEGDVFAVCVVSRPEGDTRSESEALAQLLITEVSNRMRVHGESLYLTCSIGIAHYPQNGADTASLLRNADLAMTRAKERGRNGYQFYDPAMGEEISSTFNTEQSLRRAVMNGELACLYQPKIDVQGGRMRGVEALVRWPTADHEMLLPDRFIPLAERTGLIKPLGQWVLSEALREVADMQQQRQVQLELAVNVSVVQLRDPRFTIEVRNALAAASFPAERLTFEIAETALTDEMHLALDTLGDLAGLGVRISIDDFGVGYGGLGWLKSLPVHEIKIDRSFVKGCAIDAVDAAIVSGLVDIAHNLGIKVVAEGVERADQIAFLTQVQCDAIQGYFLGMPMSATDLLRADKLWKQN